MAEVNDQVEKLFEVIFTFQKHDEWLLPPEDVLYTEDLWQLERFMCIKKDLNKTKAMLNDMGLEWHIHTSEIDKGEKIRSMVKYSIKPSFFSNAWCKFIEIISTFPLLPSGTKNSINSFHLCEAPGGFISAIHYYLCLKFGTKFKWKWYANTLNPYYEGHSVKKAVVDDRLIFPTIDKWYFGRDNTGDILNVEYHSDVSDVLLKKSPVDLVTADGGVDCLENPGEQESIVASLKLSEVVLALNNLKVGGCCVLKRFTLLESSSICTMYILNCAFNKVHVFKPVTSKSGNSEVYVVCLHYMGKEKLSPFITSMKMHIGSQDRAIIPLHFIPSTFLNQLEECCRMFADNQIASIKENINLFSHATTEQQEHINKIQQLCVELYFKKFELKPFELFGTRHLVDRKKFVRTSYTSYGPYVTDLKSLYFKTTASSYNEQQVKRTMAWEDHLQDIEKRLNECFSDTKKRKKEMGNSWYRVWQITNSVKNLYDGWIVTGKKFSVAQNSKFCNPLLLYLWNEISYDDQVKSSSFSGKPTYKWEWNSSQCLIAESSAIQKTKVLIFMEPYGGEEDNFSRSLTSLCENVKSFLWKSTEDTTEKCGDDCKTFVLDTTVWYEGNLNQEVQMKRKLLECLQNIIKCLNCGDCLIINTQSFLTRFSTGVLFIVLSLFSAFSTVLPEPTSPPSSGQLWILNSFQSPWWTENVLNYFQYILTLEEEQKTVLEVVPVYELCGTHFFDILLNQNNMSLIQRLKSLIRISKLELATTTT